MFVCGWRRAGRTHGFGLVRRAAAGSRGGPAMAGPDSSEARTGYDEEAIRTDRHGGAAAAGGACAVACGHGAARPCAADGHADASPFADTLDRFSSAGHAGDRTSVV